MRIPCWSSRRPGAILALFPRSGLLSILALALVPVATARGQDSAPPPTPIRPGTPLERTGDEIIVCGQLFHTTAPVVLWTDPGGYDAYRVERRFVPLDQAGWRESEAAGLRSPVRFGLRGDRLTPDQVEQVRGGGWSLPLLQQVVDQFVIHYDVAGTSRTCFKVLHDLRGLSVHFMLDVDGTIYQTMDLKEAAYHATIANRRSIGIEIANMGAYPPGRAEALDRWYEKGPDGVTRLTIPGGAEAAGVRNLDASFLPDRPEPVVGTVRGMELVQYDLTPEQYDSLTRLTASLCTIFPKLECDYPRDASGNLITDTLSREDWESYRGLLGHYHVQTNKVDPGPAFQWDRVIEGARALMDPSPARERDEAGGSDAEGR
ncbi:peptidoglycan recognition protein family protein [Tautonia sociabilis]|uniref:N-acetylmuramoyl-L-alanine amidase n=1 Tax=Tautonia sociabilis TaxID=2080755 RepID=A0A432MIA7_9BACT|nr:peptidoglycan recognition family protein [Tautonia sociabilis]RUL87091.1 N-acetylmuramoyl-L-alanine amidase [Tautonia sociabilis]